MIWHKYVIIEYEDGQAFTPVIVEFGPHWKLLNSLKKWVLEADPYCAPEFIISGKARKVWNSLSHKNPYRENEIQTIRKIVKIDNSNQSEEAKKW